MINFFGYLMISTLFLSISYGVYLLLFRKESGFKYLRVFLIASILISLFLPLSHFSIESGILRQVISTSESVSEINNSGPEISEAPIFLGDESLVSETPNLKLSQLLLLGYLPGVIIVLLWVFLQLFQIIKLVRGSQVKKSNGFHIATNKMVQAPFSFFSWIFLPEELEDSEEGNIIISHEMIHVSELHSLDILLANLLCSFMWFNPLIWRLRNSIQQIHEYLADEGTISSGIDRNVYMGLMLNQATEKRLVPLYSGFNRSLLKKRMVMMTKVDKYKKNNYKILVLVPLALFFLFAVGCMNGSKGSTYGDKENVTIAVETVKMNVVYCGVDNPVIIAANGIDMTNIEVEIDNGIIKKMGEEYLINPARTGHAIVDIIKDGVKIGSKEFRVLGLPNPQSFLVLNGRKVGSGEVILAELVKANGIKAEIPDFLFDVDFRIAGFQVKENTNATSTTILSETGTFSDEQRDFIKRLKPGQRITIEEIRAIGPDGVTRLLNPLEIKVL